MNLQGNKPSNVPKAEPRSFLPCSNDVICGSALGCDEFIFSKEAIQNFEALGEILKEIHFRLIKEGYILKDGEFIKNDEGARDTQK